MKDLFARNLASAIREATNAALAAKAEGQDDLTCDLVDRAVELLERAAAKSSSPPPSKIPTHPVCPACKFLVPEGFAVCNGDGSHPFITKDLPTVDPLYQPPHACDDCHDKEALLAIFNIEERPGCFVWLCAACSEARRKKESKTKPASSKKKPRVPKSPLPVPDRGPLVDMD